MRRWIDPVPELKRQLAADLVSVLGDQSQVWGAWSAHIARSRVSEIKRGHLENVSLERLIRALSYAGYAIEVRAEFRGRLSNRQPTDTK